jgi:hypothetical protein
MMVARIIRSLLDSSVRVARNRRQVAPGAHHHGYDGPAVQAERDHEAVQAAWTARGR